MIDLEKFKNLQKAYNNYVHENTVDNKDIYLYHIDECIGILITISENEINNKKLDFYLNYLNKIRTKIILPIGDETDFKYITDIIHNQDNSKFKILETEEFYKKLINFIEHKNSLMEASNILRGKKGGFIKGDENLLKIFDELKKKLNNI